MSFILTLKLDPVSEAYFENLRQRYFPPARNQVPAHVTLFHNLPETEETVAALDQAATTFDPFILRVTGVRNLGRGVAYTLASPTLDSLHQALSETLRDHLIAQDRQLFRPHVVIQNKATPAEAKALFAELQRSFTPASIEAHGLDLWIYLNGPWQHERTFAFSSSGSS